MQTRMATANSAILSVILIFINQELINYSMFY